MLSITQWSTTSELKHQIVRLSVFLNTSYILKKFIIDNTLFPPKWKNVVYNKDDLLPVYMHAKRTQEDPCYFNKELPSKDDNSDKEIENNKVDKENKENIPNNKPFRVLASNKAI